MPLLMTKMVEEFHVSILFMTLMVNSELVGRVDGDDQSGQEIVIFVF